MNARGDLVYVTTHPDLSEDTNYVTKIHPDTVIGLTMNARDNWRLFIGSFAGHQVRTGLITPGGVRINGTSGEDLNNYEDVFVELFGQHAYGFISLDVLKGPAIWRENLKKADLDKHDAWVEAFGHVQSLFNEGYVPPINLNEFDRMWFSPHECPETQLYVNHAPDMHETQLNSLLLT